MTLAGSGGVGKTRLALAVGAEVLDRYPGGVWWAELAPVHDALAIAATVLAATGGREDPQRRPSTRLRWCSATPRAWSSSTTANT